MKDKLLLSERLRPQTINEFVGQKHITHSNSWLIKSMQMKKGLSLLFFGPPGCGKTTLARLYAKNFDCEYISVSGVDGSISHIKNVLKDKRQNPLLYSQNSQTILFIDEIHRLNKAQQDIFLPLMEDGTIILIGATTENPSFVLNNALLSRLRVISLKPF